MTLEAGHPVSAMASLSSAIRVREQPVCQRGCVPIKLFTKTGWGGAQTESLLSLPLQALFSFELFVWPSEAHRVSLDHHEFSTK